MLYWTTETTLRGALEAIFRRLSASFILLSCPVVRPVSGLAALDLLNVPGRKARARALDRFDTWREFCGLGLDPG